MLNLVLQVYGDQEMHNVVRSHCMDYILQNSDYFSQYITEDIVTYVDRKRYDGVHGNHLEIQALSEMYNRPIHIFSYGTGKQVETLMPFSSTRTFLSAFDLITSRAHQHLPSVTKIRQDQHPSQTLLPPGNALQFAGGPFQGQHRCWAR